MRLASWREGRWRALEDGVAWACRAQDAGPEPAIRSIAASGAWQAPSVAASGQAAALFALSGAAAVDGGAISRAQRVAEWTLGALESEASMNGRLHALAGVLDAAAATGDDALRRRLRATLESTVFPTTTEPVDAGRLAILRAEASGSRFAASDAPPPLMQLAERIAKSSAGLLDVIGPGSVTAERLVDLAEVLWSLADALPSAIGAAAAKRIAGWLVDRFEVRGVVDRAYPRPAGREAEWAPVETMTRLVRVWLRIFDAAPDQGWFLNAALNLLDIVVVSQHRPMLRSNATGSVPFTLAAGGVGASDGHAGATVAFLLATLAEQEALFRHALSSKMPVGASHAR